MSERRDPDRLIHAFLIEGQEQLHDQAYDAVRASIEQQRQRVVIGPWRMPDMNKLISLGVAAAAVVVVIVLGTRMFGSPAPGGVGGGPTVAPTASPSPQPFGGTVTFQLDGAPVTTVVEAVLDGTKVSGTAISTFVGATHTVGLECGTRQGDHWAVGGTIEDSSVLGEQAGRWSAVFVREGSPQQVAVWLSDEKKDGSTCLGWLGALDLASIDPTELRTVTSGTLVALPDVTP